ncbi:AraC-like DNA-binding protein [Anaerotaenia torta]|uniref:AraC family transcriptional regulator n=1 Tax=Anaerotaenia torta TaxID=433293 RepID=UPI003D1E4289
MKPYEDFIHADSDYYVYSPSITAQNMFFYPLYTGHFIYQQGYSLHRDSYDSFLLMYIQSGSLTLSYEGRTEEVPAGYFVFIDCYKPHSYCCLNSCECIWCHFDGLTAKAHYSSVVARLGNVFSMIDPYPAVTMLTAIYNIFQSGDAIKEPLISKYLTDIMTSFLLYTPYKINSPDYTGMAERTISYINEHFAEKLSIEQLAGQAGLSPYHFIRTFKRETGLTPYEYLVNTRMNTAKYLLKNSRLSIKDICFNTGFSSESVFCNAFKKHQGATPAEYRTLAGT